MTAGNNNAEVERIKELAEDELHVHRAALKLAGQQLIYSGDEIAERAMSDLDDEIVENEALYEAYDYLTRTIVQEIERIGKEMIRQSKNTD